jgi:hypothetical protein
MEFGDILGDIGNNDESVSSLSLEITLSRSNFAVVIKI